jgi:hypothetical protein
MRHHLVWERRVSFRAIGDMPTAILISATVVKPKYFPTFATVARVVVPVLLGKSAPTVLVHHRALRDKHVVAVRVWS